MLRSRFLVAALPLLVFLLLPTPTQAQFDLVNFCTIFEQFPNTSGVESALFESWDSNASEWDANERWILSYQNGSPTEFRFQERTQTGAWADSSRALASYDGANRLTECTLQSVDAGLFVDDIRTVLSYNSAGRVETETVQNWDTTAAAPTGTWIDLQRSTYAYDGSGNVTLRIDEFWDRNAQNWIPSSRTQNTYDGSNRLTEQVIQTADGSGGWINSERTENSYGPNGLTQSVEQVWDLFFQTWQDDFRTLFTYPGADTEVETDQFWTGSAWENDERRTTQLNANDVPEVEIVEQWTGSAWINNDRTQNSYTTIEGTLKLEQSLEQMWILGSSTWENESRITLSYSGIIPVELASFGAWSTDARALLRWQTASETNNAGFEVHHRADSKSAWRTLGFVESNVTSGTTSEPQSYRFRTAPLSPGVHHFRLRQVDLDGTASLTDPVSVSIRMTEAFRLPLPTPHPISGPATISFAIDRDAEAEVTLYNLLGQRVVTLHRGPVPAHVEQTLTFNTNGLATGRYILRLQADGRVKTRPITVVR